MIISEDSLLLFETNTLKSSTHVSFSTCWMGKLCSYAFFCVWTAWGQSRLCFWKTKSVFYKNFFPKSRLDKNTILVFPWFLKYFIFNIDWFKHCVLYCGILLACLQILSVIKFGLVLICYVCTCVIVLKIAFIFYTVCWSFDLFSPHPPFPLNFSSSHSLGVILADQLPKLY